MHAVFRTIPGGRRSWRPAAGPPWNDDAPVREELFSVERLEQHAESLALAQGITRRPPAVLSLQARLTDNAAVLLAAYRAGAADLEKGTNVAPAAEWLLDNYHLVEGQIREIRDDLPPAYYRQLPKLASGPFAGYPRVFGVAWAFVAHTDSHFDPETLIRFIAAYQRVQPLMIGELWAVAITLRIVLIENLRRLADQITAGQAARTDADTLADHLLAPGGSHAALAIDIARRSPAPLSEHFAAQLAKRLRDQDPQTTPALGWLEERLRRQGSTSDDMVHNTQQRQGASNVTVRNIITSMRLISDIDWADLFESVSLVDARLRTASPFDAMDFPTRNLYRSAIEQLARGSPATELAIADQALAAARLARAGAVDAVEAERVGDPGHHLIGEGRRDLERALRFRPPARLWIARFSARLGIGGYVAAILLGGALSLVLAVWALWRPGAAVDWLLLFALAGYLPATEVATALLNRVITWSFGAVTLPGLELTAGIPPSLRTLVAVPTLLTGSADLLEQIERLEIHHLSSPGGDLAFALLLDGMDADQEHVAADDDLLAQAVAAIDALNHRHEPGPMGPRFLLLHRRRVYSADGNRWMGWERKRGKLHELNRLLRGADDTTFIPIQGRPPRVPADVRYVITLDADTRLPRDAVPRLIGKMAHPLNRPRFSAQARRVVAGHGILQPRVMPSLPVGREGSVHQRVFSGPGGMDPYVAAVSDVYQDLFGEGSYTGKGIYDVDAFESALAGRVPDHTLLSHDLFEGVFVRAGLASDVAVVEEFPARYDVAVKRQHRWTRGDWQLLPWIVGHRHGWEAVPPVGRWKMVDNLRRSLLAPATLAALALAWLLPTPQGLAADLLVLSTIALPAFLPSAFDLLPRRAGIRWRSHFSALGTDLRLAAARTGLAVLFLADQAWRMGDAIVRTLVRMGVTHRHLLEWTTAAQSKGTDRPGWSATYWRMAGGVALGLGLTGGALALRPASWPLAVPFALLWLAAPAVAAWISRPPAIAREALLSVGDARDLRLIARRTWRFFETFVTPADNMLPPDNFQEDPRPVVAHRTSPTNIGLYLLSAVVAHDFGWAGTLETVERLEATLATMGRLPRFRGHFLNWYGTRDLRPLDPPYVSCVDSGNLAGHLIALANACEEWVAALALPVQDGPFRDGMADTLHLARQAVDALPSIRGDQAAQFLVLLDEITARLTPVGPLAREAPYPTLRWLTEKAEKAACALPATAGDGTADLVFWFAALRTAVAEHERDQRDIVPGDIAPGGIAQAPLVLRDRLLALADTARAMALGMDFAFLLDPERKLLSIGYGLPDNRLDGSCYDLLASEARLASLFAIAKGDVPTRHWFRLGRSATPLGNGSALISWSGSMFEYLMPSLVMRAPAGSLLEQTNRLVVGRQKSYARSLHLPFLRTRSGGMRSGGMPWGISESAYNARDMEFTYQYSNFGVPGLGLKRGLSESVVIAPYATGLAAMVDPQGARRNYAHLAALGAAGRYGYYEALDFTRARLPDDETVAIIRSFMAHHQGMTIVAIANTLQDGRMRARFHREPMIQACELLLQESMPRNTAIAHPRAEEVKASVAETGAESATVRRVSPAVGGAPVTHLLSNGRYAVMLTASGAGYSRWRDIAVTRWREDATRDDWGSFIFLRDRQQGTLWSAGAQPVLCEADQADVVFGEDLAEFTRRDGNLTTVMDVLVSGEDDAEVRRISLTNSGRRAREIDITSYAEMVLASPASDNAHPAFAKMFVQTEYLAEFGALIATRRPRSPEDAPIWAAHFTVVEGEAVAAAQYETDRAQFIGRGRTVGTAAAMMAGRTLSNTVGTVLDPIFSLRQSVSVPPGMVARVAFWTVIAASRAALIDLIDKHHDHNAFDRAKTLAWTQAQVQLRHLDVTAAEAADFQRLAAPILYADARFRAPSDAIIRGAGPQSGLWPHAISGDLPIVLLRIDDEDNIAQVRQLLRAQEYWRLKRLNVDLVIINERVSSYVQDLQQAIEEAVRRSQSLPRFGEDAGQGKAYVLRADLMTAQSRALLRSVARVALIARQGTIADQLAHVPKPPPRPPLVKASPPPWRHPPGPKPLGLTFFNGLGGFDQDGREYVILLSGGMTTPAPWINVIANPGFGFQVAAEGGGYTWAENSRENQLTPWSNDPIIDPAGEAIYIRDEVSGDLWTATANPIQDGGSYIARHGFGYSRFEHQAHDVALDLLHYVPLGDPVKISRLTVRNLAATTRRLTVTAYVDWVLGSVRGATGPSIITEIDAATGALLACNPWNNGFPGRAAFADLGGRQTAWTADRTEFLGREGSLTAPAALIGKAPLSGGVGAGRDPCAALQRLLVLAPGESAEVVFLLGQGATPDAARALIIRYRAADLDQVFDSVGEHWRAVLGAVQVKTPDKAMNILLNGWLLYQTIACRLWARAAFYQASGAYGFRDQLQDGMALSFALPGETRRHLLRAAGRQFIEGDVQHWWLPQSGQGVRTRISDDRVWLAFAAATYVNSSGDATVLDEVVPFLEGPALRPGDHDAFFQPMAAGATATLFEHCARALDQCLDLTGAHGLPLMGSGDWNDGMNRVGPEGRGESVWLGWLLLRTIALFAPLAMERGATDGGITRAERWRAHAVLLREALEWEAWDGDWYRRATFDDGTWLGTRTSGECRIDSIAQSWAVLSGAADPERAATAMASLERWLIQPEDGLALLFTPPFDKTAPDPGYIQGYPPGLRENGGQYSHAAMWAILAFTALGEGDKATALFSLINPINHARTPAGVARYKVEPYVVAADVYSVAPHVGRGGWTWYTGAAGWMYRAGLEGILGIRRRGAFLVINPCLPTTWAGFDATVETGRTRYQIHIAAPSPDGRDLPAATLDGAAIAYDGGPLTVPLDGGRHVLLLRFARRRDGFGEPVPEFSGADPA